MELLESIKACPGDSESLLAMDRALSKQEAVLAQHAAVMDPFLREADFAVHSLGVLHLLYVAARLLFTWSHPRVGSVSPFGIALATWAALVNLVVCML